MAPRYKVGQKVIVNPAKSGQATRDARLEDFVGKRAIVENYHFISPPGAGEVFLYTVHIEHSNKDLVLYDDELRPAT